MRKRLKSDRIHWLSEPESHNYPSALSYLRLLYDDKTAEDMVARLRRAPMTEFKARDIFRASSLPLLGLSNSQIKKNNKKIKNEEPLSPILLIRDSEHGKMVVADGYHRVCSVYHYNDNLIIPAKIV